MPKYVVRTGDYGSLICQQCSHFNKGKCTVFGKIPNKMYEQDKCSKFSLSASAKRRKKMLHEKISKIKNKRGKK